MADLKARVHHGQRDAVSVLARGDGRGHLQVRAGDARGLRERRLSGIAQVPLVGEERVGAPAVPDTHRPGAAALEAFRPSDGRSGAANGAVPPLRKRRRPRFAEASTPPRSTLVFRCFRPSLPADVVLRGERPVRVRAGEARGRVTACAGPWRVSGEWWTPDGWQYQEWDVEVGGRLYRACCERTTGQWFLAGEYD